MRVQRNSRAGPLESPELTTEIGAGGRIRRFAARAFAARACQLQTRSGGGRAQSRVRAPRGRGSLGRARARSDRSRRCGRGGRDGRYGVRPARRAPGRGAGRNRAWVAAFRALGERFSGAGVGVALGAGRRGRARARRRRARRGRRVRVRPAPRAGTRGRWRGGDPPRVGIQRRHGVSVRPSRGPRARGLPRGRPHALRRPALPATLGRVHSRRHHPHRRRRSLARCHRPARRAELRVRPSVVHTRGATERDRRRRRRGAHHPRHRSPRRGLVRVRTAPDGARGAPRRLVRDGSMRGAGAATRGRDGDARAGVRRRRGLVIATRHHRRRRGSNARDRGRGRRAHRSSTRARDVRARGDVFVDGRRARRRRRRRIRSSGFDGGGDARRRRRLGDRRRGRPVAQRPGVCHRDDMGSRVHRGQTCGGVRRADDVDDGSATRRG